MSRPELPIAIPVILVILHLGIPSTLSVALPPLGLESLAWMVPPVTLNFRAWKQQYPPYPPGVQRVLDSRVYLPFNGA